MKVNDKMVDNDARRDYLVSMRLLGYTSVCGEPDVPPYRLRPSPKRIIQMKPYTLHLYDQFSDHYVVILDGDMCIGYVCLEKNWFDVTLLGEDKQKVAFSYVPHCYLEQSYRRQGIMASIYSWIAKTVPLLCNTSHSVQASRLWTHLLKTNPAKSFVEVDDQYGVLNEIRHSRTRRYIVPEQRVMIGCLQ